MRLATATRPAAGLPFGVVEFTFPKPQILKSSNERLNMKQKLYVSDGNLKMSAPTFYEDDKFSILEITTVQS